MQFIYYSSWKEQAAAAVLSVLMAYSDWLAPVRVEWQPLLAALGLICRRASLTRAARAE